MARPRKEVDTSTYAGRFAVQLKAIREKRKLTIKDVAEQSGIPVTTIYNWEEGIKQPKFEQFPKLAEVFHVAVPKLMPQK
jgi:transcriptional regulator with XRE-family HTH domain